MRNLWFSLLFLFITVSIAQAQYDTLKTASGLKYVVVKKGTGVQPVKGQKVEVNYIGSLLNGKRFDPPRGPASNFKFKLGNREVIPGWEEGVMLMHVGEKGFLFVPPQLGYGAHGVPDEDNPGSYIIPPNAVLMFEIELVNVK